MKFYPRFCVVCFCPVWIISVPGILTNNYWLSEFLENRRSESRNLYRGVSDFVFVLFQFLLSYLEEDLCEKCAHNAVEHLWVRKHRGSVGRAFLGKVGALRHGGHDLQPCLHGTRVSWIGCMLWCQVHCTALFRIWTYLLKVRKLLISLEFMSAGVVCLCF
jgi:hypothetical protein